MLFDLVAAVWIGSIIGAVMKLASPHRNWVSWIFAALVGGVGAVAGLFAARFLGFSAEDDFHSRVVSGICAAAAMVVYAVVSRVVVRKTTARAGRFTRPTIAF